MKRCKALLHALDMVIKNKKSYLMLSVTIVLSFTFFLSYLILIDSNNMTEYGKDIYSNKNIIEAMCPVGEGDINFDIFIDSLSKIKDTQYYVWKDAYKSETSDEELLPGYLLVMPKEVWGVHDDLYNRIFTVNSDKFILQKNQAIVSEKLYEQLRKQCKDERIVINYPIEVEGGKKHILNLEIVDGCFVTGGVKNNIDDTMFISYETLRNIDFHTVNRHAFIYSKYPEQVVESMRSLGVAGISTYENKMDSFRTIAEKIYLKQIIAIVLFVILGINLYSSFKNALNDRKFEIGVKRAVGASKMDIIKQFMYEGMIVVAVNILLSTFFAVEIFVVYKLYRLVLLKETFIIYISPYSIFIFLTVSIFMTVAFSLVFAIQSSKVEIIKHLKAE